MSRAGTQTDNAAMEAINGWLESELFTDFHVTGKESIEQEIEEYIKFFYVLVSHCPYLCGHPLYVAKTVDGLSYTTSEELLLIAIS